MRQAFVHRATRVMAPEADQGAPGASVTVALCGHWDHEPPCPLSPHYVHAERVGDELSIRVLFAAEPEAEGEVRRRIDLALSGQWEFPHGFATPWRLQRRPPTACPHKKGVRANVWFSADFAARRGIAPTGSVVFGIIPTLGAIWSLKTARTPAMADLPHSRYRCCQTFRAESSSSNARSGTRVRLCAA